MFGKAFYGKTYYGGTYFSAGKNLVGVAQNGYFGKAFFGNEFYGYRFFPHGVVAPTPTPTPTPTPSPTPSPTQPPLISGYMSGSYVTRMSEAEFQRRRKLARYNINDMALRIFAEQELPELHAELVALTDDVTIEQKRAREKRIADIIDRQIYVDYETELRASDDEEEELMMAYLLN